MINSNILSGVVKLSLVIFIPILIGLIAYIFMKSIIISVVIILMSASLISYRYIIKLMRFRKIASKFYAEGCEAYNARPLYSNNDDGWVRNVAYSKGTSYSVWVRVIKSGVVCFFRCYPRNNPVIIDWSRINLIEVRNLNNERGIRKVAKLDLTFEPYIIYLPWRSEFSNSIPASVGFNEINL